MASAPIFQDDRAAHAAIAPMSFHETGSRAGESNSLKVGFTVRNDKGKVVDGFAFLINPQGLTRQQGSRSQMFATKAGFYVDDFGPSPVTITMRQLVAGGSQPNAGTFYTAREDVQRFLKRIWLPVIESVYAGRKLRPYFHDNHLERGFEEEVYFPPDSLSIQRDVQQHNVWLLQLTMIGLERRPYTEIQVQTDPISALPSGSTRVYVVRSGDSLDSIVSALLGKNAASPSGRLQMIAKLVELNPDLAKKRTISGKTVYPYQVAAGERLAVPG